MSTTEASPPQPVHRFEHRVIGADSAKHLRLAEGDDFPDVLATSRMVALMEVAAARAMRHWLKPGELSVGVTVNVEHLAPTPLYQAVQAEATFQTQEGRLYRFDVRLFDAGGEVGRGTHTRAIVQAARLEAKARERVDPASVAPPPTHRQPE